ncbi:hypothetical protein IU459_11850 [Nocardia amamiensis]|uniref:Uncharacterized protein n=1 Tax=Nocardia amamiensis TaxID=404578 RepID=A0ABS0CNR6_9NOCA|nr:hypothetical protein [Nocardia amamiensis]MBF6298234.1 hypothetical protein [Nocardia amamiensis]
MVDTGVYAAAHTLIERLALELASTRAGAPCVATLHAGNMVPAYGCGCENAEGIAWTRVVSTGATVKFPQPLAGPVPRGQVVQLLAVIELGVDRCYWQTEDNAMPDPPAILDSMARDALDDAAAMRRAALCADLGEVVLGLWTPRGPQGGIHGGTMTVTVLVDTCGCGAEMPPVDSIVPPLAGDPRG